MKNRLKSILCLETTRSKDWIFCSHIAQWLGKSSLSAKNLSPFTKNWGEIWPQCRVSNILADFIGNYSVFIFLIWISIKWIYRYAIVQCAICALNIILIKMSQPMFENFIWRLWERSWSQIASSVSYVTDLYVMRTIHLFGWYFIKTKQKSLIFFHLYEFCFLYFLRYSLKTMSRRGILRPKSRK